MTTLSIFVDRKFGHDLTMIPVPYNKKSPGKSFYQRAGYVGTFASLLSASLLLLADGSGFGVRQSNGLTAGTGGSVQ